MDDCGNKPTRARREILGVRLSPVVSSPIIEEAFQFAQAKTQGEKFFGLGPENIRSALINRGRDSDAARHTFEQMRNAAGLLQAGTQWNNIRNATQTYTDANQNDTSSAEWWWKKTLPPDEWEKREALKRQKEIDAALTPRAGEYRPLTAFQRFRVRLYLPLFRLARRRGVVAF